MSEYILAVFRPLWDLIANLNVPGFNVSFLIFYLGCMMIFAVCSFINKIIDLNVNYDIRLSQERTTKTRSQTVDSHTGEVISDHVTYKRRYR